MNISFTKKCRWQIKNGSIRSFNKDSTYKVDDSFGKEIISLGYAIETLDEKREVEVDKPEQKKEKKSIKDYVKKVMSSDENKSKDDDSKKQKSKKNK